MPFDIVFGVGTFGCIFGPVSFCCSIAAAGIAAAITYQCGKKKYTDFTLRCESAGNFEIQINEDGISSHGCNHHNSFLKSVEDILKGGFNCQVQH